MSKQITIYLLDVSPSAGQCFDVAKSVITSGYAARLLKGRKTDFVETMVFFFTETAQFAEIGPPGEVQGVARVLEIASPPKLEDLRRISSITAETDEKKTEGNPLRAWLAIFQALEDIKAFVGRKKFTKKVVLLSDFGDLRDEKAMDLLDSTTKQCYETALAELKSQEVSLSVFNVGRPTKLSSLWQRFCQEDQQLMEFKLRNEVLDLLGTPEKKLVRPIAIFLGQLRFFADPFEVFSGNTKPEDNGFQLEVEAYPCIKKENGPLRHMYHKDVLNGGRAEEMSVYRTTDYGYFERRSEEEVKKIKAEKKRRKKLEQDPKTEREEEWEDSEDDDVYLFKQKPVAQESLEKAYKYMAEYVPVLEALEKARVFKTVPGLDFLGAVELCKLPGWYLLGESVWVVAKKVSDKGNRTVFSGLVDALLRLKSALVCRYVKKMNQETQIVALIPQIQPNQSRCFAMTPLPTFENMRNASFSKVDRLVTQSGKILKEHPKLLPNEDLQRKMDDFVAGSSVDPVSIYNPAIHVVDFILKKMALDPSTRDRPVPEILSGPEARVMMGHVTCRRELEGDFSLFQVEKLPEKVKVEREPEVEEVEDNEEMMDLDELLGL